MHLYSMGDNCNPVVYSRESLFSTVNMYIHIYVGTEQDALTVLIALFEIDFYASIGFCL